MSADRDRLYKLLPVVHRQRDEERGFPLRAVLRVIAEQVSAIESDIARTYDNWFIETCEDWVVPYIGDLIGHAPVHELGDTSDLVTERGRELGRILVPRLDVANTIGYRRRKGTGALLELLASDVAGWPARVVEFDRLVAVTDAIDRPVPPAAQFADMRDGDLLSLAHSPFDRLGHLADVRRISSGRTAGRYGISNIGLFVWRLRVYRITRSPAYLVEERAGDSCYTFSILGNDTQLYSRAVPETDPTAIAGEENLPIPLRRRMFEDRDNPRLASAAHYGDCKSLALWLPRGDGSGFDLIPRERIVPADLSEWRYTPDHDGVAVDPVLGRIVFAADCAPRDGVWVSYRYAFSAEIGGGEYERTLRSGVRPVVVPGKKPPDDREIRVAQFFRVAKRGGADFETITEALAAAGQRQDIADAIIEIADSEVYEEPRLEIAVAANQILEIRAATGARPVIRQVDWRAARQDDLSIVLGDASRCILDGLLISGRGIEISAANPPPPTYDSATAKSSPTYAKSPPTSEAPPTYETPPDGGTSLPPPPAVGCERQIVIRHCTLVPGWALRHNCDPERPAEPSISLTNSDAHLIVEHSIVGSIQINETGGGFEPVRIDVADSVVDATDSKLEAIGAPGDRVGHARLSVRRSTIIGRVLVHEIDLGENAIFDGEVTVARRQRGCIRFCYVDPGSRTPRRYRCQPETAVGPATGAAKTRIERRVRPRFTSRRYGSPGYCQLAERCPANISQGADDRSEMGVFHDLYQPQRTANLRTRLTEYVPAGVDVEIIFAS